MSEPEPTERSAPGTFVAWASRLVGSRGFQRFITLTIIAAGVLVGVETDQAWVKAVDGWLHIADGVILAIFAVEIILKMIALWPRPLRFFRDAWNVFDFIIVIGALLPFVSSYALILRLFRLFRVLKLVRALPRLQRLVGALLHSLPSMAYVLILLLLLFYVYGCAGVFLFGENDPDRFGTLPKALLSLFQVVTLEDWPDLMNPQLPHMPVVAISYFVSFILIGTMVMLNLVIGVVLEGMKASELEIARAEALRRAPGAEDEAVALERELTELSTRASQLAERVRILRRDPSTKV